ncbi:MAG: nucleoside deaminase [Vulcanimicrobiota bacterium]
MNSTYPGVRPGHGEPLPDLRSAVELAQQCAWRAHQQGTFCVGGVLLGPNLQLLAESSNHVLWQGGCDPTAHGERQLVDWYFDQPQMPAADQCTVVSTLDPCMMCAGALLYGGFRVLSLALDLQAGVNCAGDFQFKTLPPALRGQARERFAYFGVEGVRPPFGCDQLVPASFERESFSLFEQSMQKVQARIHSRRGRIPAPTQWRGESAALLDESGQAVAVAGDGPHTRTAIMELARHQALKDLTLVQRVGPDLGPLSIMEMGAYGSCLEGPLPPSSRAAWQYLRPGCPAADLSAQLRRMPPHYRELVGIRIEPAGSPASPL